jgi:hypothetical protein
MLRRCVRRLCVAGEAANGPRIPTPSSVVTTPSEPGDAALNSAAANLPSKSNGFVILKDYKAAQALRKERAAALKKEMDFEGVPLRYKLIEAFPGMTLSEVKMKYLLTCRKNHPAVPGGDHETFLRLALAYQDCLKDYGLEFVGGRVRNLGNFQTDPYQAQQYLIERHAITEYIPLSTLDDHIRELESAQARIGEALISKIAANNTESFWLLEDIETVMNESGTESVILSLLEDGSIKVDSALQITGDPMQRDMIADGAKSDSAESEHATAENDRRSAEEDVKESDQEATRRPPPPSSSPVVCRAEVTKTDVLALNAKYRVEDRVDIAGEAARAASGIMNTSSEHRSTRIEMSVTWLAFLMVAFILYATLNRYAQLRAVIAKNPNNASQVALDTMLPWWGNDKHYEQQVKRIFVEEWRRARSSAQRQRTFQDGVARESMSLEEKEKLDLEIFSVTSDRLKQMKNLADSTPGRQ